MKVHQNGFTITAFETKAIATVAMPIRPTPQAKPAARTGLNINHRFNPKLFNHIESTNYRAEKSGYHHTRVAADSTRDPVEPHTRHLRHPQQPV